jgi:Putative DNA-binding domain
MSDAPAQHGSQPPRELNQVQRWLQTVVTHPDGVRAGADCEEARRLIDAGSRQLEQVVTRSKALTAAERLAIYANAYYTRLLECLGEVYPVLKRAVGDEAFDGFAFGYLQDYPSRSYTLNELGRHFPRYLSETRPVLDGDEDGKPSVVSNWPDFLIDLARLEWMIYEVFDGPGVETQPLLRGDEVLDLPADRWPQARLKTVVCLQLLATCFPVNDYYTATRKAKDAEAVPIPEQAETYVAVTRRQYVVRRYNLTRPQFELLSALKEGRTVGEAIGRIATAAGTELESLANDLKFWFRNWTAEGFFQEIEMPG